MPLSDVKLKVDSDQFAATVAPAPSWKTYPELPPAADGGAKGCFTVSLRRKAGSADDGPDVALRVYATCRGTRILAATLTLAEALDEHRVPFHPSLKIDGKPSPQFWGNALVLKDFIACQKRDGYLVGYKSTQPGSTNQTRVYLAADDENLCLLVATVGYGSGWFPAGLQTKIFVAAARDGRPFLLAVDDLTSQMTCTPAVAGAKCVKCSSIAGAGGCDAVIYQVRIPRKSVGIEAGLLLHEFLPHHSVARRQRRQRLRAGGAPARSGSLLLARERARSVAGPGGLYGKMILEK